MRFRLGHLTPILGSVAAAVPIAICGLRLSSHARPWVVRKQIASRPATSRSMSPLRRLTTSPTGAARRDPSCAGKIGHPEERSLLIGVLRGRPRLSGDLGVAGLLVHGGARHVHGCGS
jgi:hypothetical protein